MTDKPVRLCDGSCGDDKPHASHYTTVERKYYEIGVRDFESKPVGIQAIQFMGGAKKATPIIDWALSYGATITWMEEHELGTRGEPDYEQVFEALTIRTLEGDMKAQIGDWIIKGTEDEFYPCKPSVFARKYLLKGDKSE